MTLEKEPAVQRHGEREREKESCFFLSALSSPFFVLFRKTRESDFFFQCSQHSKKQKRRNLQTSLLSRPRASEVVRVLRACFQFAAREHDVLYSCIERRSTLCLPNRSNSGLDSFDVLFVPPIKKSIGVVCRSFDVDSLRRQKPMPPVPSSARRARRWLVGAAVAAAAGTAAAYYAYRW